MRNAKRTQWWLWRCDLAGCDRQDTTHDILEERFPPGWVTIDPPKYWKGPSLAFCSDTHRDQFLQGYFADQVQKVLTP